MEQAEKIKMESDTFALRRDYKRAIEDLARVKSETAEVIGTKEKVTKELEEKQVELSKVLADISQEKLDWATFRHSELVEIENKQAEVQNVINWKADLNKREEELRKMAAEDIEVRNETRRIELKVEDEKKDIASQKRAIDAEKALITIREKDVEKRKEEIKDQLINLLEEVKEIK